jgi:hypothetical protein
MTSEEIKKLKLPLLLVDYYSESRPDDIHGLFLLKKIESGKIYGTFVWVSKKLKTRIEEDTVIPTPEWNSLSYIYHGMKLINLAEPADIKLFLIRKLFGAI